MKWSELKTKVDKVILFADKSDPDIIYIDIDDHDNIVINIDDNGLVIRESFTKSLPKKPNNLD